MKQAQSPRRRLWRLLPNGLRIRLRPLIMNYFGRQLRSKSRKPDDISLHDGQKIAVLGLFRTRTGLGNGAELVAKDIERHGATVTRIDVTPLFKHIVNVERQHVLDLAALEAIEFDVLVIHLNPPEFVWAVRKLPERVLNRSKLVGFFVWELERIPDSWRWPAASCNQIWVPSAFVARAFAATFPDVEPKLHVREYSVEVAHLPRRTPDGQRDARLRLTLRPDSFVVLTSFSFTSVVARKNPLAGIAAFRQAYADCDRPAEYLIRCLDADEAPAEMVLLENAVAGDRRIRLVQIAPAENSIGDAYLAADAYLSLHRSEGFGLNLAEALAIGLPVIATEWGLSQKITSHPNFIGVPSRPVPVVDRQHIYDHVPGASWAEPEIEFAAQKLRELLQNA